MMILRLFNAIHTSLILKALLMDGEEIYGSTGTIFSYKETGPT